MNNERKEIPAFEEFCKNYILDEIDDFQGNTVFACDLGIELTEIMRSDGSFTYSTEKAKGYLMEWFDEAGEFSKYEKFAFGKRSNPFENVELFLVRMVSEGVGMILSRCEFINKKWNEKIELTPEVVAVIKNQVEEVENAVF